MVGRPGLGRAAAAPSSSVSSQPAKRSYVSSVRPGAPRGRHRPRPQLLEHLLPQLRRVADVRDVDGVEREVRGERALVVAGDAVAIEDRPVGLGRVGNGGSRLPRDGPRPLRSRLGNRRGDRDSQRGDPQREREARGLLPAGALPSWARGLPPAGAPRPEHARGRLGPQGAGAACPRRARPVRCCDPRCHRQTRPPARSGARVS